MTSPYTDAVGWHSATEPTPFVAEEGNCMRGILVGAVISAVLWAALCQGIWVGLTFVGLSS
jgi:hypothetical protein